MKIWSSGNFVKIWYFVNYWLIKVRFQKSFCTLCDTYNCDYLPHNTFSFLLNQFSVRYRFTQRTDSQENAFKKSKNPSAFFPRKTIGSNNLFYSNWKQFQIFKMGKFEFKVTVHYSLWAKCTQLWPLKGVLHPRPVFWTVYAFFSKTTTHW